MVRLGSVTTCKLGEGWPLTYTYIPHRVKRGHKHGIFFKWHNARHSIAHFACSQHHNTDGTCTIYTDFPFHKVLIPDDTR